MQRWSATWTVSAMSTVTTAGIGVITLRACCSCRWKTPESITASPGSSVPPLTLRAIRNLRSSEVVVSSPSPATRTPNGRRISSARALRSLLNGLNRRVKNSSGLEKRRATPSAWPTV